MYNLEITSTTEKFNKETLTFDNLNEAITHATQYVDRLHYGYENIMVADQNRLELIHRHLDQHGKVIIYTLHVPIGDNLHDITVVITEIVPVELVNEETSETLQTFNSIEELAIFWNNLTMNSDTFWNCCIFRVNGSDHDTSSFIRACHLYMMNYNKGTGSLFHDIKLGLNVRDDDDLMIAYEDIVGVLE